MLRQEKIALLQGHHEREEDIDNKSQKTEKIPNRAPEISLLNLSYKPIMSLVDHFNAN